MNLIYLDESGNTGLNLKDKQQPVFLLAAIVIHSSKWFTMEKEFNSIMREFFGDRLPEELHAIDLRSRRKEFGGLPQGHDLIIRDRMLQLLIDHEIPLIYRSINKIKFERFCEDSYGPGIKIDPYIMALPFVCMEVNALLQEKGSSELGMLIFDEQKESFNDAEKSIKTLRLDTKSILKTTNIIEKGFFVDSKKSFALQLADFVALFARKLEEHNAGIKVNKLDMQTFEKIRSLTKKSDKSRIKDILEWVKMHHVS